MTILTTFMSSAEDPHFLQSVKSHPRYHLRLIAIVALAFGFFFNILAIAIVKEDLLSGLAFIPLTISMVWNHLDLVSKRLFKTDLPVGLVVVVDALGFLSFLALLIANGIIASQIQGYWRNSGDAVLLTYTSVPWMFCCAIHSFIFLKNGWKLIQSRSCLVCPDCRRPMKATRVLGTDHAKYSRMVSEYDSDDVEATPISRSGSVEEFEQTPAMRESMDIPDESACLIVREP